VTGADRQRELLRLEREAVARTLASTSMHALNNPLAAIAIAASALDTVEDAPQRARLLGVLRAEAMRAGAIAGTLSGYRVGTTALRSPVALRWWLHRTAAEHRASGIEVTVDAPAEHQVSTDAARLYLLIGTLLADGGAATAPSCTLGLTGEGSEVHITVTHTVHDRHQDLDDQLDPLGGEAGTDERAARLALAVARSHAVLLGGRLTFTRPGPGRVSYLLALPVGTPGTTPESLTAGPAGRDRIPPPRALVVDDEASIRGLLETLLRRDGWEVTGVGDGPAAVAAARAEDFDLVLIDVRLGGQDGEQVLAALRAERPALATRTAFMTGAPPEGGRIAGRPVLGKPFTWADLSRLLTETTEPTQPT
jgi:CheY-like chemotaxis protein